MTPEAQGSYQVVMPKLGLTMTEATLVEWLKADGDRVEKGEPLFVLESDKSTLEIEAPASGLLHILIPAGQTVPVQTPIAEIGDQGTGKLVNWGLGSRQRDEIPIANLPIYQSPKPASPKARALARRLGVSLAGIAGSGARGMIVAADVERAHALQGAAAPKVSPVARRLAAQAGVDLTAVAGSGPGGRIMRQDVEEVVVSCHSEPERSAAERRRRISTSEVGTDWITGGDSSLPAVAQNDKPERGFGLVPRPELSTPVEGEVQPLGGLRAIVAERLSASWRERPHVTLTTEADATNLVSARQQLTAELGQKVAYDALLVALVARALRQFPYVNARLTERGIEQIAQINVGVAVDTERGLLVPVVHDAASKGLLQVQRALAGLVERARAGRSQPDDLTGGTFTITNLGMFDIDAFTPLINPPESAILGVGRIVAKPVVVDRQVVVRDMLTLSLSFDHRLIDGAPAARFLQRVKQLVERPFALVV